MGHPDLWLGNDNEWGTRHDKTHIEMWGTLILLIQTWAPGRFPATVASDSFL
jgi:hypothetical protein